ncbi:MAG: Bro-N domain-containing protein, partial [Trichodesmium sp. St17_bin3_1_1]|nr:Bro-N domain-containing protein [Trichodesmium sp. St17_bin3_1_1]
MENNQTFHFQGKEIQIKVVNNEPWFLAADIAKALTVKDTSRMINNANIKEKHVRGILNITLGGEQKMLFVDEAGMYKILMKSRKAVAE